MIDIWLGDWKKNKGYIRNKINIKNRLMKNIYISFVC